MTRLTHLAPVVLPTLSPGDLEKAARVGFAADRSTAEIADRINACGRWHPIKEADIANALARVREAARHG